MTLDSYVRQFVGFSDVYEVRSRRHALSLAKFRRRSGYSCKLRRVFDSFERNRGRAWQVIVYRPAAAL